MVQKKHIGIGLAIVITILVAIAFLGGYIVLKRTSIFKNEREVSSAITNVSEDVQEVSSTLAELDKLLR